MKSCLLFSLLLFAGAGACSNSSPAQPDAAQSPAPDATTPDATTPDAPVAPDAPAVPPPTTIQIVLPGVPLLVTFRDGPDAAWQPATMKTPETFEISVHGPYVVSVVRDDGSAGRHEFTTQQFAQTPDDDHVITIPGRSDPTGNVVSGHMVQAGTVSLGASQATSSDPEWDFQLKVDAGAHDLIATTADRILIKHAVDVAGDLALPPIDVATDGVELVSIPFTASNPPPGATILARASLSTPTTSFTLVTKPAPAGGTKVAPDSVLVASDIQSVSVQAIDQGRTRALRRPFRIGGDTSYAVPTLIVSPTFTATSDLGLSWTSVSDFTNFSVGASSDMFLQSVNLEMTQHFVTATALTHVVLDTQIPGFQPEWRIDFAGPYTRDCFVQHVAEPVIRTDSIFEKLNVPPGVHGASPRARPAARARAGRHIEP